MLTAALLPQALTVVRYVEGAEDEYGNATLAPAPPVEVRGRLEQVSSDETTLTQDTVRDRWRAFLPAGTSISAGDDLYAGDRQFRVDGTPEVVYGATSPHHLEVVLTFRDDVEFPPPTP